MYKLDWTDETFRITGDYLGVVSNYGDRKHGPSWVAKIVLPMNEDKPTHSDGPFPTAVGATNSVCENLGVDPTKADLLLAKASCRGVGEFHGDVCEEGNGKYTAGCAPSITSPYVTLIKGATKDEAKAAVQAAFEVYTATLKAVLDAASEVEKEHTGKTLTNESIELVIKAASDVGFRLPL